jgi:hypothetical protein
MAKELVRYEKGKPTIQDGLIADSESLVCDLCDAEYRVHYSAGEINRPLALNTLRISGLKTVNDSHSSPGGHPDSIIL